MLNIKNLLYKRFEKIDRRSNLIKLSHIKKRLESQSKEINIDGKKTNFRKEIIKFLLKTMGFILLFFISTFQKLNKFNRRVLNKVRLYSNYINGVYKKYLLSLSLILLFVVSIFFYLFTGNNKFELFSKYSDYNNQGRLYEIMSSRSVDIGMFSTRQLRIIQHIVKEGDTLESIANKYSTKDNKISVDSIIWTNGLKPNQILKPGMMLEIPPVNGIIHTVKSGENIISIAKKYNLLTDNSSNEAVLGITQQIVDINLLDVITKLDDKGEEYKEIIIVEGQKLIIPGGYIKPTPTPTPRPRQPVYANNTNNNQNNNVAVSDGYLRWILTSGPTNGTYALCKEDPPISGVEEDGWIWPVYEGIGVITNYFNRYYHKGLDIAYGSSNYGPYLVSMANGYIFSMRWENGGGAYVARVMTDSGYILGYSHMACFRKDLYEALMRGEKVRIKKGEIIGRMGNTGNSTGPHVHLEVIQGGVYLDPCVVIDRC